MSSAGTRTSWSGRSTASRFTSGSTREQRCPSGTDPLADARPAPGPAAGDRDGSDLLGPGGLVPLLAARRSAGRESGPLRPADRSRGLQPDPGGRLLVDLLSPADAPG